MLDRLEKVFDDITMTPISTQLLKRLEATLDEIFYILCEEYPGSVVTRQSFDVYKRCAQLDLRHCNKSYILELSDWDLYTAQRWHGERQNTVHRDLTQEEDSADSSSSASDVDVPPVTEASVKLPPLKTSSGNDT